ncbi:MULTISPECIES: mechanosensitive ion channel family protein [Carboxydothermus]|uniref:Mechanosensitive ion channel family protein n=2 Tax=Carboxydothermus TaxID=129957 RepID=Q3AG29_CARHZ|nr:MULTISPECIES: mechanosensitive ion channel family protein [Carboxydothermus]ABB16217.1 mechanosensitive ion channel family protein [Carboxydothermus hydrogenoformans Z-2901]NYE57568.1 small conductance mechanosensitive channel [Carboxydothermus ferrireducens DSM 11255]
MNFGLLNLNWDKILDKSLILLIILVSSVVLLKLGHSFINRFIVPYGKKLSLKENRVETLRTILKSLWSYFIYITAFLTIIAQVFENTGFAKTLLTGAGILGLAVSFGAQNLVKDVISGFFILMEDQFAVGDYVTIGQTSGIVEELGLRVTKLRDFTGELHIIPNGSITMVTNKTRGPQRALVDVGVAYEEDVEKVNRVLERVCQQIKEKYGELIYEGPKVLGIVNFGPSEMVFRVIAKVKPMEQWNIEWELRKAIKEAFDAEGIEIPYPRRVYITREEREMDNG